MLKALIDLNGLHKSFTIAQGALGSHLQAPLCIPNCGRCCTVKTCMIIEAINMVSTLTGLSRLKAAIDCAENWLLEKTVAAADEVDLSYKGLPVGVVSSDIKQEWEQVSQSRCPFLTSDLTCLIYECRPMLCMALGITREVKNCPRPLGVGETYSRRAFANSGEIAQAVQRFKDYCDRKPEWKIYGFAPTLLFRAAQPEKFRALVDDNRIPSAKIIGTEIDVNLMWQPQLESLRAGEQPEYVVQSYNSPNPERTLAELRN